MKLDRGVCVVAERDINIQRKDPSEAWKEADVPKGTLGVVGIPPHIIFQNFPGIDGTVGVTFDNGVSLIVEEDWISTTSA